MHTVRAKSRTICVMNIEDLREYCLSLPLASEYFPFDESVLAFRVMDKIFAMIDLADAEWFVLKCDPELALELREEHPEINGAWHMNKKYWNQVSIFGSLSDSLIKSLIRHSYSEVVKKFTNKAKSGHPEILTITKDSDTTH